MLAHAETAESDQTIIVTATTGTDAAEVRAAKTPGGADIVGYEDYADKSIVSLRDTLAFSPGVYLQPRFGQEVRIRSEEHTSELQSLMRISYAVFCLKKKNTQK